MTKEELEEIRAELAHGRINIWDGRALVRALAKRDAELERLYTVLDEAFGPFPVMTTSETLSALERNLFEQRKELESAREVCEAADAWEKAWTANADDSDVAEPLVNEVRRWRERKAGT